MKNCKAFKAEVGKLEERLASMREALKAGEEKIEKLEARRVFDAKAIAHLSTLMIDHRSSSLHVAFQNGEFRRKVNYME